MELKEKECFRLLYSEICSYCYRTRMAKQKLEFSSPIFGDMFLLVDYEDDKFVYIIQFSSPIFGDMFLLGGTILQ